VASFPAVTRAEIAGSYRRLRDTVGDLDIVAATSHPSAVARGFAALPAVERVIAQGDTKSSVLVANGFQVDCRAVAVHEFGAALQYFTGSQAHNVQLRGRALRLGMTLNEYGLFHLDSGARVAGEEEVDVYESLGLSWIPPERREGRGEIEASALGGTEVRVPGRPVTRAAV
jgi:DNA polymerase (family 10)